MAIAHRDEAEMAADLEIVSREDNGHGVTIRAVSSSGNLPAGAKPVDNPNLVETYLAFMASRGRTQDVSASGEEVSS